MFLFVSVDDGIHASCNRLCDAMVCLAAPLCDIVYAALQVFDYCGTAFGAVLALPVSGTVQGGCL